MKFVKDENHPVDVNRLLRVLEPSSKTVPVDAAAAYEAFRLRRPRLRPGWRLAAARPLWAGMAAACALLFVIAFAPARGWAQHILEMLRVQRVAVVPVDMSDVATADGGHGKLAAQFLSDNVVVTMKPGKPVVAGNIDAAGVDAGFAVRTMPGMQASGISVSGPAAFHMTLNRDRIEALLDAVGRADLSVPASVDGSTVAVFIPKAVQLKFGDLEFDQVPTPTVSVPKTLDMAALAEAGLQIAGMSAAEAQVFSRSVDWTSTLVIPIPQAHSSYRTVEVDGVNGTLIEVQGQKRAQGEAGLVWVKNGMVYSLHAGDAGRVLAAAASLN